MVRLSKLALLAAPALAFVAAGEEPSCSAGEGPGCSVDASAMLQTVRRHGTTTSDMCDQNDHVQCPGSNAMCSGRQCCPGADGAGSFPCPSAPIGWGAGSCQVEAKVQDCVFGVSASRSLNPEDDMKAKFDAYLQKFGKSYDEAEYQKRFATFKENIATIESENRKSDNMHDVGLNEFTDVDPKEFKSKYMGFRMPSKPDVSMAPMGTFKASDAKKGSVPLSWDWRDHGAVTPVKSQGSCGSCWTFSTTGAIEGAYFLKTGKLVTMSEQQIVDCADNDEYGCNGGWVGGACEYVRDHGLATEAAYSYKGQEHTCKDSTLLGASFAVEPGIVKGYLDIEATQEALLAAVYQQPTAIAIEADEFSFQFYWGGIIKSGCGTNIDHAVLAVGFGQTEKHKTKYWIVKNSWGPGWGEDGYVRILRGASQENGECGILSWSVVPVM